MLDGAKVATELTLLERVERLEEQAERSQQVERGLEEQIEKLRLQLRRVFPDRENVVQYAR